MKKVQLEYYSKGEVISLVEFDSNREKDLLNVRNYCFGYGSYTYDYVSVDNGRLLIFPERNFNLDDSVSFTVFKVIDLDLYRKRLESDRKIVIGEFAYSIIFITEPPIVIGC